MRRTAFTLTEVLFAVVLLAMVVGVCVPYMRSEHHGSSPAELAEFSVLVDEEIERFKLSHASGPTLEELGEIMDVIGSHCVSASRVDDELQGQWIAITNGSYTVLRWARVEPQGGVDGS